jgi:Spherulation-specific family 4
MRSSRRPGRACWWLALLVSAATTAAGCSAADSPAAATVRYCGQLVLPAYFYSSSIWAQASDSKPPPSDIILDISGIGAGSDPLPHFRAVVRQARARGITVLGYISTVDGQRPAAQVETEVRNYKAWYGVTDIFLDRVSGQQQQVAYYRQLASYIHQYDTGSSVWLNPGDFPARAYMSIGNVVMVFEGTYAQYLTFQVPSWTYRYPASKFAHTIYATPGSSLSNALTLAAHRQAGHVYITDGSGANPYAGLPSYWSYEVSAASAGCGGG